MLAQWSVRPVAPAQVYPHAGQRSESVRSPAREVRAEGVALVSEANVLSPVDPPVEDLRVRLVVDLRSGGTRVPRGSRPGPLDPVGADRNPRDPGRDFRHDVVALE